MSFTLKPENTGSNGGFDIDFDAIAEQVDEGTQGARVSVIVDLGVQKRGKGVAYGEDDTFTVVETEEEADALINEAIELLGEKVVSDKNLDEILEGDDDSLEVPFKIYEKKDAQEIAIFADLTDTVVDYGDKIGEKQFRIMLNPSFKGDIRGFALVPAPPKKKGGVWTFAGNSKLAALATACGRKEILQEGDDNMNIGLVLGEALLINVEKKGSFINAKGMLPVMKGYAVADLDQEAVGITFDSATVELLKAAKLRKGIIEKIKTATNYEGSAMQKAIEALEAGKGSSKAPESASDEVEEAVEEEAPKEPTRRRKAATEAPAKKEEAKPKRRGRPAKKKVEEEDFDDVPF